MILISRGVHVFARPVPAFAWFDQFNSQSSRWRWCSSRPPAPTLPRTSARRNHITAGRSGASRRWTACKIYDLHLVSQTWQRDAREEHRLQVFWRPARARTIPSFCTLVITPAAGNGNNKSNTKAEAS